MPLVSIVIRAWRPEWLDEAIASVLAQSHADLELVIYDDNGSLEAYARRPGDSRVRYHRAAGKYGASGRLREAVALTRGEFIGVLDDDDRYEPAFVARLLAALALNERHGVAFCRTTWLDRRRLIRPADDRPAGVQRDIARAMLTDGWTISPSHFLIRRAALDDIVRRHPLPDNGSPDVLLNIHAAAAGWTHVLVDDWLVVCRWHASQLSRTFPTGRDSAVATFQALRLNDPDLRDLRDRRLARAHVARAFDRLRHGDAEGAEQDLRDARNASPAYCRLLRWALRATVVTGPAGRAAAGAAQAYSTRVLAGPPARIG